jgi:hypothetical protein
LHQAQPASSWINANWFVAGAVLLLGTDLAVLLLPNSASPRLLELGLLCDLCIVLPSLYLACYWRKGKRSVLRAIALASIGFWASSKLLPESGQFLIQQLWPFRYVALAVIVLIEFKIMLAVYRAVFSGASRKVAAETLEQQSGMPRWAAKLAVAEASLWSSLLKAAKAILSSWRR